MRPKVLVIDDDDLVLDLAKDALGTEFEVIFASTAEGAINAASRWEFDVVCCDFTMPETNGSQILEEITQHTPDARCFLLTDIRVEEAMASRIAFAVVTKPFRPSQLAELVDALAKHDFLAARRVVEQWGANVRRATLKPPGF